MSKDYYTIMGVSRNASDQDIKTAYRKLARKYHPDLNKAADAEAKFKELGEAYEVLKDKEKRQAYDQFGEQWQHAKTYQQQGDGKPKYQHQQYSNAPFDEAELFETLFGHKAYRQQSMKGEDIQATLSLSLEQAYAGGTQRLDLPIHTLSSEGYLETKPQTFQVKIPAGVTDGQKIRLAGMGGPSLSQGPKGDLYLTIALQPHALYEVKAKDIYLTLPITPWEAALGATIQVPTLSGMIDLKIPHHSQGGQKLRLKGKGLGGKEPGDAYVLLKLVIPPTHSEEAEKLYQKMAEIMPFNPRDKMGG